MKNLILITALLIALSLTACSSNETIEETSSENTSSENISSSEEILEPNVGVVNPMVEVLGTDDFITSLGINLTAPSDSEVLKYVIISDEVAQITYLKNDLEYTLRASKSAPSDDIHGVYSEGIENILSNEVLNDTPYTINAKLYSQRWTVLSADISDINLAISLSVDKVLTNEEAEILIEDFKEVIQKTFE